MPARRNGLSVTKWLHPRCFAAHCISFDYAPTGRAKCSVSGVEIQKGNLRLTMDLTSCEGKVTSRKIFHPPSAAPLVQELLACNGCKEMSVDDLCASLTEAQVRSWALDALTGRDVSNRPVPAKSNSKPDAKPKARPMSKASRETISEKPTKKQKKAQPPENDDDGSDDGEAVD